MSQPGNPEYHVGIDWGADDSSFTVVLCVKRDSVLGRRFEMLDVLEPGVMNNLTFCAEPPHSGHGHARKEQPLDGSA